MNCGSLLSLKVSTRCGLSPNAFQIRPTVDFDSPVSAAIDARDQCVASAGCAPASPRSPASICSSVILRGAPGRGSSASPSRRLLHEPPPPLAHRLRPHPHLGGHLLVGFTCRATQHDPTPLRQRLRGLRPPRPPLQRLPLLVGQHQLSHRPAPTRHPPSLQLINEFLAQDTSSSAMDAAHYIKQALDLPKRLTARASIPVQIEAPISFLAPVGHID